MAENTSTFLFNISKFYLRLFRDVDGTRTPFPAAPKIKYVTSSHGTHFACNSDSSATLIMQSRRIATVLASSGAIWLKTVENAESFEMKSRTNRSK